MYPWRIDRRLNATAVRARFHSCHDNAPQPAKAACPPKKIPAAPNRAAAFSLTVQSVSLAVR
jgi:hypothetical protein